LKVTKPGKQRKRLYQAPHHERHKQFSSPLSPGLRASHNTRSVPVRKGDTVQITRGDFRDFEGKVLRVDRGNYRITVEGVTRERVDGTSVPIPVHPSKVVITGLNLDDEWRKKALQRRGAGKEAEKEAKPPEEKGTKAPQRRREGRKVKEERRAAAEPGGEKLGKEG